GQIGRWSKVIEAETRIAEIADGTPAAREALRRIAAVYERDLELPERALEVLHALVGQWPDDADAFAALDRLGESHGRWAELADVLARRAALATAADERAELLARRAAVLLDRLGQPAEAAPALRPAPSPRPPAGAPRAGRARSADLGRHRARGLRPRPPARRRGRHRRRHPGRRLLPGRPRAARSRRRRGRGPRGVRARAGGAAVPRRRDLGPGRPGRA